MSRTPNRQRPVVSLVAAALAAVAAACGGAERIVPPEPAPPRFELQDGSTGGNAGFHFLPPLVANPPQGGTFDASLSPTVVVCEVEGGGCARVVAQFSRTAGTGAEVVRVDAASQQYVVNWNTDQCAWGTCSLSSTKTYRIQVRVATALLGFADVQVFSTAREARNATTGATVGLVNGRTLPIKFRVAAGVVATISGGQGAPIGATGGLVATADGALSVAIPSGAVAGTVQITATPVPPPSVLAGPGPVAGTVFEMGPDGTQFAAPVTLALAYDPAALPAGVQPAMLRLHTFEHGQWVQVPGSRVDPVAHTVQGQIAHFSLYALLPQRIRWAPGQPSMGLDQVLRQDVRLPEALPIDVTFTLQNRNATLTVGEPGTANYAYGGQTQTYTMPAGSTTKIFGLYSDRLGTDTLVVAAPGFLADTLIMPVVRGNLLLAGWPESLQYGDSAALSLITRYPSGNYAGVAHPKTFTLTASPNIVFTRGGQRITTVELTAGAFQSAGFHVKVLGGGPATVTITNPDYEPLTDTLTAIAPRIRFAPGERAVGLGQVVPQDVTIPAAVEGDVQFFLTNRNSALTILEPGTANNTGGGQTGSYVVSGGTSRKQLTLYGERLGTDTLIVAAPGYLPDTVVIATTLGRLIVTGLPTTPLQAGDSVPLTIIQTLPSGHYASGGYTERYTLSAGPNAVLTRDGQTIGTIDIVGFQSPTFYLRAVAGGGATLSITNPHYEPYSAEVRTYQVWDVARDFPTTNPGRGWTFGWTASLGAPFNQYPDYFQYHAFISWTQHTIRSSETPDVRKNVTTGTVYTVPPGAVALHPGCSANQSSVVRWTAPADATYEVAAQFFEGDNGRTSAHVLRNGQGAAPLFAAASTDGSPRMSGAVTLNAGETLDFVVGVADDRCFGDTTPVTITVTRR